MCMTIVSIRKAICNYNTMRVSTLQRNHKKKQKRTIKMLEANMSKHSVKRYVKEKVGFE